MDFLNTLEDRLFGGGDDGAFDIDNLSLEELNEEKAGIRADVKLKRDRHQDLSNKRENLFEKIVDTEDDLLKRELAEEIASIEDEMAILHNEHTQLMDSLRVVDGLIAIKRKQKMAERTGLLNKIREMNKEDLVEKLRRADVREMIREEKWDQLNSLLSGQLSAKDINNERVDEIVQQANDVKQLEEDMGTKEAVEHALRERDEKKRQENVNV